MFSTKKIQLVLGSGGARGIAHIGVIEMLQQDGFEIESVIGCSMGAVVGGIYCTGHLPLYRDWLLTLTRPGLFSLLDFTLPNLGFLKGEKILGKMHDITGDQLIENLKIPYTAVATDLVHHKEVCFREGDLYTAMRASMSIPGVFTPVVHEDSILVDGGVLNPLPLNCVDRSKDTLVVAVSLNGQQDHWHSYDEHSTKVEEDKTLESPPDSKTWIQRFLNLSKSKQEQNNHPKYSLVELLGNSYEFTQDRLVELTINAYKPDILIEVPRTSCGIFDFHKAAYMIDVGKDVYQKTMEDLKLS